ncbi:hypothetical protein BAL199_13950 [alpha proteobacterium BAL199]|nr:hypothetical protein BAL199_13950 [alpha proteobacterium BAL199]
MANLVRDNARHLFGVQALIVGYRPPLVSVDVVVLSVLADSASDVSPRDGNNSINQSSGSFFEFRASKALVVATKAPASSHEGCIELDALLALNQSARAIASSASGVVDIEPTFPI